MGIWDYLVLAGYFVMMAGIGVYFMRQNNAQEDYFMGGRSFGKLLQTFAAFGAGTGSSDPVNTGRTTFTSGMSGMWSVMYWLFVTPFYWITGVWYRRMRLLTLGDWFVERYESQRLGAAYALFGILFYVVYGSMLFSAIGKVAAPLVGTGSVQIGASTVGLEYVLVPVIGVVVLIYGVLGGLRAAYVTDLIQGLCIILLSVLLIPYGMYAIVQRFGDPAAGDTIGASFRLLHERLPPEYFEVIGSSESSEFTLPRIIAVVIINLVGIVIQPHFIATGGGSAKTEMNARVGLVLGNFLKRICTIGWVLTALFALALFAESPVLAEDPDKTWGVASRELLGPGLSGLMLACLLAALMSSVDAYMIVGSALVVRNIYAPFVNSKASEKEYVMLARFTGAFIVGGAVVFSLMMMDVFAQLQLTWVIPVLFAAPFWVGMYWRRATTSAAWGTILFCAAVFFVIPQVAPLVWPGLRVQQSLADRTYVVATTSTRDAAHSDVARRQAAIQLWDQRQVTYQTRVDELTELLSNEGEPEIQNRLSGDLNAVRDQLEQLGARPEPLVIGEPVTEVIRTGGQAVFWTGGVRPVNAQGMQVFRFRDEEVGELEQVSPSTTRQRFAYPDDVRLQGQGSLRLDFLLYKLFGMDLKNASDATLATLELPPKIVTPFLVMIGLSWFTRRNSQSALDRYYIKMKTPVDPDPKRDEQRLAEAYARPEDAEARKLFPGTQLEFQRPNWVDIVGFLACFAGCFAIIGLAIWVGGLGSQ
jgi:SSS family solute:Na+ symporter